MAAKAGHSAITWWEVSGSVYFGTQNTFSFTVATDLFLVGGVG